VAIVRKYKRKIEDSWIEVLQDTADLVALIPAAQIQRWDDVSSASNADAYVLVYCAEVMQDPDAGPRSTLRRALVNVRATTHKASDKDAETVDDAGAAIEDLLYSASLLSNLELAVANLTTHQVLIEDSEVDDSGTWRVRQFTLDCRIEITPP